MAQYSFFFLFSASDEEGIGELRPSSYKARWIPSVYVLTLYTQVANWFAWLWSSCSWLCFHYNTHRINYFAIALTCRLFHLCIFLLFISENVQSSPPAGREGKRSIPFFCPPHLKNLLTALLMEHPLASQIIMPRMHAALWIASIRLTLSTPYSCFNF